MIDLGVFSHDFAKELGFEEPINTEIIRIILKNLIKYKFEERFHTNFDECAFVAVDDDGEMLFFGKPSRWYSTDENNIFGDNFWLPDFEAGGHVIGIPAGTIEKIIGRKLTWDDEPVKIS